MSIFSNLIDISATVISLALALYIVLIIAHPVVSWVGADRRSPIVQFLNRVTEPVLFPVRRLLPLSAGGFDISIVVVIIGLLIGQAVLLWILFQVSAYLRYM